MDSEKQTSLIGSESPVLSSTSSVAQSLVINALKDGERKGSLTTLDLIRSPLATKRPSQIFDEQEPIENRHLKVPSEPLYSETAYLQSQKNLMESQRDLASSQSSLKSSSFGSMRVKSHTLVPVKPFGKKDTELSQLSLLQTLHVTGKNSESNESGSNEHAIQILKFSPDGQYLAAGTQNGIVHVWSTFLTKMPTSTSSRRLSDVGISNASLEQPMLLKETPIRVYQGHEGPITDLAWSKHNFLASASVDRTVRIWHVRESFCLCIFKHPSGVSGLRFHPKDDRILLTGCADSRLRLWSLAEKKVLFWNELPVICPITCLTFDREANLICVGTANGDCIFYEYDGLKYNTQINVMSTSKVKRPFKVTGIDMIPSRAPGDDKFLVTAADSRIRMYHLHDKSLVCKFKGHEHRSSSFQASVSDDGKYILCPSEDKGIYLWKTDMTYTQYSQGVLGSFIQRNGDTQKVNGFEKFSLDIPMTCAIFPPKRLKYQYSNHTASNEKIFFGSTMSLNMTANPLENVLIVCADAFGSIHIFINKAIADVDTEKHLSQSKASGLFKTLRTRMASADILPKA